MNSGLNCVGKYIVWVLWPGPALPCCSGEEWALFCTAFRHQHVPRRQPRPGMSAWLLVVTDPCCCRTTDPGIAPGGSTGQDPTMVPDGTSPVTHIRLFPDTLKSPVQPLFIVPTPFFLFSFLHHLLLLEVPRVSGVSGVISGVVSGMLSLIRILWPQAGGISNMAFLPPLPRSKWGQTDGHLRLVSWPGPMAPV